MAFNYLLNSGELVKTEFYKFGQLNYEKKSGIYIIVNKNNGKAYIGQTKDFKNRLPNHEYRLEREIHANSHLQRAYKKDKKHFVIGILETSETWDKAFLDEREAYYIGKYKTLNREYGYNLAPPPESKLKAFQKRKFRNDYVTSEVEIMKICKALNVGKTRAEIAEMCQVNPGVISGIASGANYSDFTSKHLNKSILAQWRHHIEKTGLTEEERMRYSTNKTRKSNARLDKAKVIKICKMMNDSMSDREISEFSNIPQSTINNIRRGKNWHDISILYLKPEILRHRNINRDELSKIGLSKKEIKNIEIRTYSKLTKKDIHNLCKDIAAEVAPVEILSKKYNVGISTIRNVISGRSHKEIASKYFEVGTRYTNLGCHMTDKNAIDIWEYHLKGYKNREIEKATGFNTIRIRRVLNGSTFKNVYEIYSLKKEA